jgi:DNA-binding CsgD family transcriptional regulator
MTKHSVVRAFRPRMDAKKDHMRDREGIPTIIDDLYAGTLDAPAWRRALTAVADLVSGAGVILSCVNPSAKTVLRSEVVRWDAAAAERYRADWIARDPRIPASVEVPVGQPMIAGRLLPVADWTRCEIYNDFLLPADAPWFLAFVLNRSRTKAVNFCITATGSRGAFEPRDGQRLAPLIPHLRRAIEIRDRLESAQVRQATLAAAMDSVSHGTLVLDDAGRVLHASAVASQLLDGVCMGTHADGTLWFCEPAGRQLLQWVSTGMPPPGEADGLLHVPRPDARPVSVTVTRLQRRPTLWFGESDPAWMLCLFDGDRELPMRTELIARDLGISARESEIVALLVCGCDARTVAARLDISIHTVRTHLKSVFAATGIRSQGQLILRVMGGPGATATR